jgi:hypothetical protein
MTDSAVHDAAVHDTVVYDSGALAAIGGHASLAAFERHVERVTSGLRVLVPAVAAAQVVRRPAVQARLMRALRGCELVPFTAAHHVQVGRLLAASGTADVVDAFVAVVAARADASAVFSSDPHDLSRLLGFLGVQLPILTA